MRRALKTTVLLAGMALVLGSASARAAVVVDVKVPFPFVVHGQSFPAGQYAIEQDDTTPQVLLIRGLKTGHAVSLIPTVKADGPDPAGAMPALAFSKAEGHYELSGIWESGDTGWTIREPGLKR